MERLLLSRHAESDFNARGLINSDPANACPLTARGRNQARALGQLLAGERIDLCVTSELQRSRDTAKIALAGLAVPHLAWSALNDPALGIFEGGEAEAYNRWLGLNGPRSAPADGESQYEAYGGYVGAFDALAARPEAVIVAIIHRLPIGLLLGALQGTGFTDVPYTTLFTLDAADVARGVDLLRARQLQTVVY